MARYNPKQSVSLEDKDLQSPDIPDNAEVPETPEEGETEISKEFTEAETTVAQADNAISEINSVQAQLDAVEEREGYISSEVADIAAVAVENIALKYGLTEVVSSLESIRTDEYRTAEVSLEGIQSTLAKIANTVNGAVETLIKAGVNAARSALNTNGNLKKRLNELKSTVGTGSNDTVSGKFTSKIGKGDFLKQLSYLTEVNKETLSTEALDKNVEFIKTFMSEFTAVANAKQSDLNNKNTVLFVILLLVFNPGAQWLKIYTDWSNLSNIKVPDSTPDLFKALPKTSKNAGKTTDGYVTRLSDDIFGKKVLVQEWRRGSKFELGKAFQTLALGALPGSGAERLIFGYLSKNVFHMYPGIYLVDSDGHNSSDSIKALSEKEQLTAIEQSLSILNDLDKYWSGWGARANKYWEVVKHANRNLSENAKRMEDENVINRIIMNAFYALPTYLRHAMWNGLITPQSQIAKHNYSVVSNVADYISASQK